MGTMRRKMLKCRITGLGMTACRIFIVIYIIVQLWWFVCILLKQKSQHINLEVPPAATSQNSPGRLFYNANRNSPIKREQALFNFSKTGGITSTMRLLSERYMLIKGLVVRSRSFCNNSATALGHHSVIIASVVINTNYIKRAKKQGNATAASYNNFRSETAFPRLRRGFLTLNSQCNTEDYRQMVNHKRRWGFNWNSYIVPPKARNRSIEVEKIIETCVVIRRYEYENVYWTIVDLYNVYLALYLYEKPPGRATILLEDRHPPGSLDSVWDVFGRKLGTGYVRLHDMKESKILCRSLIWMSHRGYDVILHSTLPIPLFWDFREFIYHSCHLRRRHRLRCKMRPLTIVLVSRRGSPGNTRHRKRVSRAILNEEDVLKSMQETFKEHRILNIQMELIPLARQLKLISFVDLLIGMHGAALAYGALMQPGSAILELFPKRYRLEPNNHMEILARANGVLYQSWFNQAAYEDRDDSIMLPIPQIIGQIRKTLLLYCS